VHGLVWIKLNESKCTVKQWNLLVKIFSTLCETHVFIAVSPTQIKHIPCPPSLLLQDSFSHFNIILLPKPRPSKYFLSCRFPHQISVCISLLTHTCHISHPFHFPWFDHRIYRGLQTVKLLFNHFSPVFLLLLPSEAQIFSRASCFWKSPASLLPLT